jgi:hypothetical protein
MHLLSIEVMIALCQFWLSNSKASAILASHELGVAMRKQIVRAYQALRAVHLRRSDAKSELRRLTDISIELGKRHNNKAGSLFSMLHGLRKGTEDPDLAQLCKKLLMLCFPNGRRFINWKHVEQGGYADAMVEKLTPALRARMAMVVIGDQTLLDLCDAWLDAGQELGQNALDRAQMEASLASSSTSPSAVNIKKVCSLWRRTARALLENVELMELSHADREALLAPLESSVAQARRDQAGSSNEPADDAEPTPDDPADEPGDLDLDDDAGTGERSTATAAGMVAVGKSNDKATAFLTE